MGKKRKHGNNNTHDGRKPKQQKTAPTSKPPLQQGKKANKKQQGKKAKQQPKQHQKQQHKQKKQLPETGTTPAQINQYNGYVFPRVDEPIDVVDPKTITPQEVWERYISKRKPVVFDGVLPEAEWKGSQLWTNAFLRKHAGDQIVKVEKREDNTKTFGRGIEVTMSFAEFLDKIEQGDDSWYLTTQDAVLDDRGQPEIAPGPAGQLTDNYPMRPSLMGNLVPQNINMWFGFTRNFSTTGLHHDFHDNLYVLLRGHKRFVLYSPADALNLYTRGKICRVFPNGRFNFEGDCVTRADGADPAADSAQAKYLHKLRAEAQLERAEVDVANNVKGAQARLAQAERELEQVLDEQLGGGGMNSDNEDDFNPFDGRDDFEDSDGDAASDDDDDGAGFDFDGQDDYEFSDDNDGDHGAEAGQKKTGDATKKADATTKEPLNFCLVDWSLSEEERAKRYPAAKWAVRSSVEIHAGQMLYLPAGWFHEVQSRGTADPAVQQTTNAEGKQKKNKKNHKGDANEKNPGHLAFNYWFHPPDADSFDKPYKSEFWNNDWAIRQGTWESIGK